MELIRKSFVFGCAQSGLGGSQPGGLSALPSAGRGASLLNNLNGTLYGTTDESAQTGLGTVYAIGI